MGKENKSRSVHATIHPYHYHSSLFRTPTPLSSFMHLLPLRHRHWESKYKDRDEKGRREKEKSTVYDLSLSSFLPTFLFH